MRKRYLFSLALLGLAGPIFPVASQQAKNTPLPSMKSDTVNLMYNRCDTVLMVTGSFQC